MDIVVVRKDQIISSEFTHPFTHSLSTILLSSGPVGGIVIAVSSTKLEKEWPLRSSDFGRKIYKN